jgi:hypothetical protein
VRKCNCRRLAFVIVIDHTLDGVRLEVPSP